MNLYVDTNVFVYSNALKNPQYEDSKKFFEISKKNGWKIATSVFTILEIVCTISQARGQEKALEYLLKLEHERDIAFIEPEKDIHSLFDLIVKIAVSSAKYQIETGDTIHLHTIEKHQEKIDYLITWNKKHFKDFCNIKKIELYTPKEFIEKEKEILESQTGKNIKLNDGRTGIEIKIPKNSVFDVKTREFKDVKTASNTGHD